MRYIQIPCSLENDPITITDRCLSIKNIESIEPSIHRENEIFIGMVSGAIYRVSLDFEEFMEFLFLVNNESSETFIGYSKKLPPNNPLFEIAANDEN